MRRAALCCLSLLAVACSAAAPETREPFSLGGGGARQPFSPAEIVSRHAQPLECEVVARQLQARSRDQAWDVLKACVGTGNFWPLRALLTPAWLPDLRFRPDAANLIAQIVASRGGEVQQDLDLLHSYKLPLFSLSDGLENPEVYSGRLVLLRAKVEELRRDNGKMVAALSERTLESERRVKQVSASEVETQDTVEPSVDPGDHQRRRSAWNAERRYEVPYYENVSVDTGRLALANLNTADPFLEPGQEYLVLARFDGLVTPADAKDAPVAKLTLIEFQRPAGLVLY